MNLKKKTWAYGVMKVCSIEGNMRLPLYSIRLDL